MDYISSISGSELIWPGPNALGSAIGLESKQNLQYIWDDS